MTFSADYSILIFFICLLGSFGPITLICCAYKPVLSGRDIIEDSLIYFALVSLLFSLYFPAEDARANVFLLAASVFFYIFSFSEFEQEQGREIYKALFWRGLLPFALVFAATGLVLNYV